MFIMGQLSSFSKVAPHGKGLRQAQAHGRRLSSSFGASDGEDYEDVAFDGAMMKILRTITSG